MSTTTSATRKLVQRIKRRNTPFFYKIVYALLTPQRVNTMNLGYAPLTEKLRSCYPSADQGLQYELYWQTFRQLEFSLSADQLVCEVGSGRGGGLAFIRNLTPAQVIGLECSTAARRYAERYFELDTRAATVPKLPLEDASVDAFVAVEAAHFSHNDAFVAELARSLKPKGSVLLADFNLGSDQHVRTKLSALYQRNGFELIGWRDIRPQVLEAMKQDDTRKQACMRFLIGPLRAEAEAYMGTIGSHKYHEMKNDERAYFILHARKL